MQSLVRAVTVTVLVLGLGAAGAGIAAAQPAPPDPPLTPADERAQLACVQQYLDLTALPQQALQDPAAFSLTVADAAEKCHDVRAPAAPTVPTAPLPAG
ncbi:hypothetical protein Ae168Ps1_0170c [Pseudonocardia sp. Ae168_Ps1]|uniref:hypothetical protein n=1 Tax=unclassified Pseudonocardia TaxID=2619320 RepID=UPI00094B4435|nr:MULTISPECIES: hypothetical protein [unclassified Pseudonocardia]OLL71797.1 hypothetical protein Ae150APs1_0175c [Pseudonocardia sp. Ae150A_Ps1]OLL77764.1 hypothetical protein Ae168Ps1_0170c [Pseudonocardia sp. Ae168_Ps1]OLL88112.1 hypothetical protein Ae263Ps1_5167 [Pseudonocardia sp. Ae263_Ps1]OLL91862.1 hypothetical protein Ae356Ps1_1759c [Pseudonocardia sp. Ae356_Ps1]